MSDQTQTARPARFLLVLIPLALMLASFVWIAWLDPLRDFGNGAPPVEALTVERTVLDETGLHFQ
jgi:zinc transporter, ZIP family